MQLFDGEAEAEQMLHRVGRQVSGQALLAQRSDLRLIGLQGFLKLGERRRSVAKDSVGTVFKKSRGAIGHRHDRRR